MNMYRLQSTVNVTGKPFSVIVCAECRNDVLASALYTDRNVEDMRAARKITRTAGAARTLRCFNCDREQ